MTHTLESNAPPNGAGVITDGNAVVPAHKETQCGCGREGKHYTDPKAINKQVKHFIGGGYVRAWLPQ